MFKMDRMSWNSNQADSNGFQNYFRYKPAYDFKMNFKGSIGQPKNF